MAEKHRFLLRVDGVLYAALERWAADEFRSVNGQIEFALREALRRSGRLPASADQGPSDHEPADPGATAPESDPPADGSDG